MLTPVLTLLALSAAPRGLPATSPLQLVTSIDQRLPKWLKGGGDRAALLATREELTGLAEALPIDPRDRKAIVQGLLEDQKVKPELTAFVPLRALVHPGKPTTTVHVFDAQGKRCTVDLLPLRSDPTRYVLTFGPSTDARTFDVVVAQTEDPKALAAFEKKSGEWAVAPIPVPAPPPPPGCAEVLKRAAKAIYVAERSYYAEYDVYSDSFEKIGIAVKELGVDSVAVKLAGKGPEGHFTAELKLKGGVVRITDADSAVIVATACTD